MTMESFAELQDDGSYKGIVKFYRNNKCIGEAESDVNFTNKEDALLNAEKLCNFIRKTLNENNTKFH